MIYIHTLSNISNEDIFSNYSEAFASKLLENLENMFVRCHTQSDMFSMSNYTLVLYPPQNGSNNREQMDKSMLQQICIIYLFLLCFVEQSRYVCSDSVSRIIYIVNFTQTHTRKQTNIPCSIHIFNSNVRRYNIFILEGRIIMCFCNENFSSSSKKMVSLSLWLIIPKSSYCFI